MSDSNPIPASKPRRSFIRRMTALVGGLFGAFVLQRSACGGEIEAPGKPAVDSAKKGYRETEHVRAYYDAARF